MVVLADGEEDADVMNIKAKDNLDIGGQVMVLQGKGKELREMITAYREQLSGLIADQRFGIEKFRVDPPGYRRP